MAATPPRLTAEQQRALDAETSVALAAGAGCGKTHVLTARFLAALEPRPAEPERAPLATVVAITFTERAAREMRARIRRACAERLAAARGDEADYWLRLWRQLDSARVSTIHSFCAGLLRSHAVEAGLDPRFGQLDEGQSQLLMREVVETEIRRLLAEHFEPLLALAEEFDLEPLTKLLLAALPQTADVNLTQWRELDAAAWVERWRGRHARLARPLGAQRLAQHPLARRVVELLATAEISHPKMRERQAALLETAPRWGDPRHLDESLVAIEEHARVQSAGGEKAWSDPSAYQSFKDAATKLRALAKDIQQSLDWNDEAALLAARWGRQLSEVLLPLAERWAARKAEAAVLDFDDLLIRARDLLRGPGREELRRRVAGQVELVLVDEFQDTDPVQVELIRALCGDDLKRGKLFFVGDLKQSIYRFRGADPRVFVDLRASVPAAGRLPLSHNFRSQPAILDFVNYLFADELERPSEPLVPRRPQVSPRPGVEFLWATAAGSRSETAAARADGRESGSGDDAPAEVHPAEPSSGEGEQNQAGLIQLEARWLARRLRELIDSQELLVGAGSSPAGQGAPPRAVRPGDIAIVLRRLTYVRYYEAALRAVGLDYYLVGGQAFYSQQEIFDVVHLLKCLMSPADELALAGVLRSPFFGLTDETLFWLSRHSLGLRAGLFTGPIAAKIAGEQRRRVEYAVATLHELAARKDRLSIAELLEFALERTAFDAALVAEFLGTRKLANLRKLIDRARGFDRGGLFTLHDYVVELESLVAQQPRESPAATAAEAANVVRLMSIHQSKGLEFPVVVVADCNYRSQGGRDPVRIDPDWGVLVAPPRATRDDESRNPALEFVNQLAGVEDDAERLRLFYVATTRAADYLILSAAWRDLAKTSGAWTELLARRFDLETGEVREPHGAASTPLVRVTRDEPPPAAAPPQSRRASWSQTLAEARELAARRVGRVPATLAPVPPDRSAPRRLSFSRLAAQLETTKLEAESPVAERGGERFDDRPEPSGDWEPLRLGTLVHAVLAQVEFGPGPAGSAVREDAAPAAVNLTPLVEREARRLHFTDEPARREAERLVAKFLASARAAEIASWPVLERELDFLLAWPPQGAPQPGLLIEGVIDLLGQDRAGHWHLLDYKTNRVNRAGAIRLVEGYRWQLWLYALAVEAVTGQLPTELVLHFLVPGVEHCWQPDADGRAQAVAELDRLVQGALAAS